MADIMNLNTETGRNIISDDATPTLTLENDSTGPAFKAVAGATANAVEFTKDALSAPTVAVVKISASGASAPALEFLGTCVASTGSGTSSLIGAIRVKYTLGGGQIGMGWVPVMGNIA